MLQLGHWQQVLTIVLKYIDILHVILSGKLLRTNLGATLVCVVMSAPSARSMCVALTLPARQESCNGVNPRCNINTRQLRISQPHQLSQIYKTHFKILNIISRSVNVEQVKHTKMC